MFPTESGWRKHPRGTFRERDIVTLKQWMAQPSTVYLIRSVP
ncbi:MAG TPA: hypothetical protein VGO91_09825 [Pyrinomonadaceae bacterium]|nr:hypothetical protein [Pyrinomonadaceae bacterium]